MNFSGKKVVVTGATRGIGRAIASAFLDQGAEVIAVYGGNREAALAFQREKENFKERLHIYQCDVSRHGAVEKLYDTIEEKFDHIDILINNAGVRRDKVLAMMPVK